MDDIDIKILERVNVISPKFVVIPVNVNEKLKRNPTEFGDRLKTLKKSGYVDNISSEFVSSLTLSNFISKAILTELGRKNLREIGKRDSSTILGLPKAMGELLHVEVIVPKYAQYIGAVGSALLED